MRLLSMLCALVVLPLSSIFAGISGTYNVHGGNPSDGTT